MQKMKTLPEMGRTCPIKLGDPPPGLQSFSARPAMDRKQTTQNSSSNSDSNQSNDQNSDFINHLQNLMHNGNPYTFSTQRYKPVYDRIYDVIEVGSSSDIQSSQEVVEIESSREVVEIESSREVIEIESSHEVIVIESSQDESYHSRFQDSYYDISYDPNREDTLQWEERRRREESDEESSINQLGEIEIQSQSEYTEDESISQSMVLDDYHDLYSQVDMNHLRELISERMGGFPEMSSEMSQANQAENQSANVIESQSEQDQEDTPQNRKTKMIKKAPKK